jgi:hypothetical protein
MTADFDAAVALAPAGVITALTPNCQEITLVTDPDGEYILVEQLGLWRGAPTRLVAHRLAPCDFQFLTYPDVTRYTRLA